jgi:uncharacterized protein (DUF1501 family)
MGRQDDVVVMTFSEFGRRVAQNGSNGTDHGTAEPMFVIGTRVAPGLHATYPSLQDLDNNGDLQGVAEPILFYPAAMASMYSLRIVSPALLRHVCTSPSKSVIGRCPRTISFTPSLNAWFA